MKIPIRFIERFKTALVTVIAFGTSSSMDRGKPIRARLREAGF
jgi:hypothetical protein